ncbi:MAG: ComEC/Rec2 family competence protein [Pyrinomonadaceae bacterium]
MRAASNGPSFVTYPLALVAMAYVCGILAGHYCVVPLNPALIILCGGTVLATLLVVFPAVHQTRYAVSALICFGFLCAGGAMTLLLKDHPANSIAHFYDKGWIESGDPVEITGILDQAPEVAPDRLYLTVRAEQLRYKATDQPVTGRILFSASLRDRITQAEYDQLGLRYGARLRVITALNRADTFRNPGGSLFTEYLDRKGYDATGLIKSPLLVERLDDEPVFLPLALLYRWRQSLLLRINRLFSPETAGVLDAALLGNRYFLSRGAAERFRAGGTFHVLVISGLHISFIGGIVFLVMRRLTKRVGMQFVVSAAVLWAYALAVGAEASVVRSALMFTLVALGPLVARRAQSLNVLGGTALVLLVWRPSDLFDPSFQLTFLSVLMIITVGWPLLQRMQAVGAWQPTRESPYPPCSRRWFRIASEMLFWSERRWQAEMARSNFSYKLFKAPSAARLERWRLQRPLRFVVGAVVISASVQVGLLPLLILYFHRLSIASLVLNIGVGVLMAALGLVAIATLLLHRFTETLSLALVRVAEGISWLMVHSVDPFVRWGLASIRLPEYTGSAAAIYGLYYVPLAILIFGLARWNPLRLPVARNRQARLNWLGSGCLLLILCLIIFHPLSAGRADGRLRIDFLDVGQGDSALMTLPDGTTMLIDGGGRPSFRRPAGGEDEAEPFERDTRSIGEAVVSEYLWWRGLGRVDYLLVTHADADHIDGLNDVARNFRVRSALVARAPAADAEFRRFAETAGSAGLPLQIIGAGDVLHFGDVSVQAIWPRPAANANPPSLNNDSVVLRVSFREKSFLLTGDIEKEAEAALLRTGVNLSSDVVKVAHHGSRTSSTQGFVSATHPTLAIISVGRTSVFGHPHKEVVERWRAIGSELLTTGQKGTITVSTDGHDLRLETFVR